MAASPVDEHRFCIIVGAGISGVLQASEIVRKQVLPYEDFEILDRYGGFGGVWYANTYPGAACDVQSHIYQVSWRRNPDWSRKYAPQGEIQQYWEDIAKGHQLERCTSFHTDVKAARWNEKEMLWVVETEDVVTGQKRIWTCSVLISCAGLYTYPKKIDVPGVDSFKRANWHSAQWPADADLKGKRVAVIGTGSSAAQFIPEVQKVAASMVVYQRSPGHVVPRDDFEFPAWVRWTFRNVPLVLILYGMFVLKMHGIVIGQAFTAGTFFNNQITKEVDKRLKTQIKDEKLQKALTCDYPFGCKRPLILDKYLPALGAANVELVTDSVVALSETGIISRCKDSGVEHEREVDVLIWGTGYKTSGAGMIFPAFGRGGVSLSDHVGLDVYWLYGVAVDEFPNFLTVFGPNMVALAGSTVESIDKQALYNIQVIEYLQKLNRGSFRRAVMPRRDVTVKWVESLRPGQKKMTGSDPRCVSNYKNAKGVITLYPYRPDEYDAMVQKPDFENNYIMLSIRPGMKEARITDCQV